MEGITVDFHWIFNLHRNIWGLFDALESYECSVILRREHSVLALAHAHGIVLKLISFVSQVLRYLLGGYNFLNKLDEILLLLNFFLKILIGLEGK